MPVFENERGTYIFNSKDLCMVEHMDDILNSGIDSLKIEGRISRFSKIGGEMVPHEALEAAIMNIWNLDPADEERRIAVVTIPDPVKGEAVALLTTLVTDYVHQARTLIRHGLIDQGLPALWCPKEIIPVERIPVLPSGKLDIKQCRMLAYEALNIPFEP